MLPTHVNDFGSCLPFASVFALSPPAAPSLPPSFRQSSMFEEADGEVDDEDEDDGFDEDAYEEIEADEEEEEM